VLAVPRGVTVKFTGSALAVRARTRRAGTTYQLVIQGTARRGRRILRRYAVVALAIDAPDAIGGDPVKGVYPGSSTPIDLRLTNSHRFSVRVRNLSVRPVTSTPGCSDSDYAVAQYAGAYPLVLRPGTTRLSALVRDRALWPQLAMRDLPRNQDACKGAGIRLDYTMRLTR
jgi:hypothetical protein